MKPAAPLLPLSMVVMMCGMVGFVLTPDHPAVSFAIFGLTMAVVGMAAWSISNRPGRDPLDIRVIDAGLLGLAFVAVCVLLLGSAGLLDWWMLVTSAGMAGMTWAMLDQRAGFDRGRTRNGRLRVDTLSVLAVGLGSFAAVQAVLGRIFRPPVGDPLAYHLPFAVEWLQRGTLTMPIPAAGDPSPPYYPLNSTAWNYWLLAPFESEVLVRFVQLPFLGLLALATYRLGRELNLRPPAASMAAALTISVPAIARSASLPENDLILAALLVTATAYLMMLARRFTIWRAGMAAVALGLAIGTKVTALAFGGPLGVVWLALVIRARRPAGFGPLARTLAAGALIVAALGGYAYLRNAVVMGNPLYPAGYDLPGGITLDGLHFPTWEWRKNHAFFHFDWQAFLFGSRREFGWTISLWAIPGLLLATLVSAVKVITRRRVELGFIPIIWVALSLLIFWYIIPYHFSRFLYATIAIAIVAGMWGLGALAARTGSSWLRRWHPLLAIPLIAVNLINVPLDSSIRSRVVYWLAAAVVVGGVTGAPFAVRSISRQQIRRLLAAGVMAGALAAMLAWPFYADEYDDQRMEEWRSLFKEFSRAPEAWAWLDAEASGSQLVIAVAGTNEVFPLYGPDLNNRVVTIWRSGERAEFGWAEPFAFYGEPDRGAWEEQIRVSDVDYVVITEGVSFGGWPVERDWMLGAPDRYRQVFSNPEIEIWEVGGLSGDATRYTVAQGWTKQSDRRID